MAKVVKIQVGDNEQDAIEQTFEIATENWNEYRLADGGIVRVKTTAQKIYRLLDANGNPAMAPDGDPAVLVKHSTQVVASDSA